MIEHRKVEERLKKILRKFNIKFKKEEFGLTNIFSHKSLDSLQLLSILTEIERTFDIKFSVKFLQNDKSNKIENIIDKILKKK
jgi:acyl carrier protein